MVQGRNVVIQKSFGAPQITKDGVTVAKHVDLADPHENVGAQLVRNVANKANDAAGDGTTTATVLTRAIFTEGCKAVAAGMNPMDLRRGINLAVNDVVARLKNITKVVSSEEEIEQVACISANNDSDAGKLLARAFSEVGKDGTVSIGEGKTLTDELEVTQGMSFDQGFISPAFITDPKKKTAVRLSLSLSPSPSPFLSLALPPPSLFSVLSLHLLSPLCSATLLTWLPIDC